MRPAIVLGLLCFILALRVVFGGAPTSSFDDRFESADAKLEAMSKKIDEDLEDSKIQ